MGNFFGSGGGLSDASKVQLNLFKDQAYSGRDRISQLIADTLGHQLSNIGAQGADASALAMQASARGGSQLAPGAVDASGNQAFLKLIPQILAQQNQAYGQAEGAGIQNQQDFMNQLLAYNQLRVTRKQPGLGANALNQGLGSFADIYGGGQAKKLLG